MTPSVAPSLPVANPTRYGPSPHCIWDRTQACGVRGQLLFVGSVPPTRFGGSHVGDVVYGFRVKRCGAVIVHKNGRPVHVKIYENGVNVQCGKVAFRTARATKSWPTVRAIFPKSVEGSSSLTFVFSLRKIKQSESESRAFQLEVRIDVSLSILKIAETEQNSLGVPSSRHGTATINQINVAKK